MICHIQIFQILDSEFEEGGWRGWRGYKRLDKRRDLQPRDMMDDMVPGK